MKSQTPRYRPADLAREHGLSTQAVRNYERDGLLPPAGRTASGYRVYLTLHRYALRAFLALVAAHGHGVARDVMRPVTAGDLDTAFRTLESSHARLLRDRETLDAVESAVGLLTATPPAQYRGSLSIGGLAHRLGVTPATLRAWERAGVVRPGRDRPTGHRRYEAADVRDADLAHLLRRGGYPLAHIATVVHQVHDADGAGPLADSLRHWRERLTRRGRDMLTAAARLDEFLRLSELEGAGGNQADGGKITRAAG